MERGALKANPLREEVAAVSAGLVEGESLLDLCYSEDSRAAVDFNVVMTGSGSLVEVQGTAEGDPFSRDELDRLVDLASSGIERLVAAQRTALGG
jgi:ribonuclease PH